MIAFVGLVAWVLVGAVFYAARKLDKYSKR
jgi:hypothetical protein